MSHVPPTPPPSPAKVDAHAAPVVDAPTRGRDRLVCVDATRGLAVLGLMAAHVLVFGHPMPLTGDPTESLEPVGANLTFIWLVNVLVLGKFMFLFALLFGASVIFFDAKTADGPLSAGAGLWYRRMGWLAVIGLAHGVLLFFGDILLLYAICGLGALWWMRRLKPWILLLVGGLLYLGTTLMLLVGMVVLVFVMGLGHADAEPNEERTTTATATEVVDLEADEIAAAEVSIDPSETTSLEFDFGAMALLGDMLKPERQIELARGSFRDASRLRLSLWLNNILNIPLFTFWMATGIMLLGMGLARLGVLTGERSTPFYAAMLVAGSTIGVSASAAAFMWVMGEPEVRGLVWIALFQVLGVPLSFAYLAAVVLAGRVRMLRTLESCLAAVGRMALSNYVLHSIIGAVLFQGWGLGWFGQLEFPALAWIVVTVWIVNIAFSLLWLRAFRFGPLEWLWRSLTYGRCQPMLRTAS